MAVIQHEITDRYAIYNGDAVEVLSGLKPESIHLSVYSPPFADLYSYSSNDRDLSNCRNYDEFLAHYEFVVRQIARVTVPGRITVVHCMDLKREIGWMRDFPGDIIRLHERLGWKYHDRHAIWKEPLRVALRTRALGLTHRQIVKDSSFCHGAGADYVLAFRREGTNPIPIAHPAGMTTYAGSQQVPPELEKKFRNWPEPKTNKLSHWIWQQYASSFWDDVRSGRVLPYRAAKDKDEEKHVCPLQLDVIERCIHLWSNPGETVLTPFMGVGSEVYGALRLGRRGVGVELKPTYFRQAKLNVQSALQHAETNEIVFEEPEPVEETE